MTAEVYEFTLSNDMEDIMGWQSYYPIRSIITRRTLTLEVSMEAEDLKQGFLIRLNDDFSNPHAEAFVCEPLAVQE